MSDSQRDEYTLELEEERCATCGKGEGWTVVDGDGVGNGVTYYDKDAAQEIADDLNDAFARGRVSLKPLLVELLLASREEADAQSEAALLTPNSDYDTCEASKARCLAAERRLEAAEERVEFVCAAELCARYAEQDATGGN